jgi:predicted nucleotidyltransferase
MDQKLRTIIHLLREYDPEMVILFGSRARADFDSQSDVDLVIVKDTQKRFLDRIKEVLEIIKPNFAIDVLVYTPEEFSEMLSQGNAFLTHVVQEGKVVYEKSRGGIETLA